MILSDSFCSKRSHANNLTMILRRGLVLRFVHESQVEMAIIQFRGWRTSLKLLPHPFSGNVPTQKRSKETLTAYRTNSTSKHRSWQ
mmetsp:Transcript_31362/g.65453  ORF Transcript_31362/g.65453 Transcript_31362/m.65453 type:complete len:86 (-) Transcript_31362:562-819(-)